MTTHHDVLIVGAGAAGLYCAIFAGRRGRRVLVLDHAEKPGKKILISGGGRCNFTNIHTDPKRFLSANPHFAISALKRHPPGEFIALVDRHGIPWHEKTLGQLFCDRSAKDIVAMLLDEAADASVTLRLDCRVEQVERAEAGEGAETGGQAGGFVLHTGHGTFTGDSLALATGGLSIPKMGATDFAHRTARRFGLPVVAPRPGLVPFTFGPAEMARVEGLAGVALDGVAACNGARFREALLITHRGLSGPSILQVSSYWRDGDPVTVDLAPDLDLAAHLKALKRSRSRVELKTVLAELLPRRFAERLCETEVAGRPLADMKDRELEAAAATVKGWTVHPDGTEGYRTAEVTLGGVDTDALSSRTLEAKAVPGLFVIGEAVDVTGWLGGYNFQWAWSSGWAAGQAV